MRGKFRKFRGRPSRSATTDTPEPRPLGSTEFFSAPITFDQVQTNLPQEFAATLRNLPPQPLLSGFTKRENAVWETAKSADGSAQRLLPRQSRASRVVKPATRYACHSSPTYCSFRRKHISRRPLILTFLCMIQPRRSPGAAKHPARGGPSPSPDRADAKSTPLLPIQPSAARRPLQLVRKSLRSAARQFRAARRCRKVNDGTAKS